MAEVIFAALDQHPAVSQNSFRHRVRIIIRLQARKLRPGAVYVAARIIGSEFVKVLTLVPLHEHGSIGHQHFNFGAIGRRVNKVSQCLGL